MTDIFNKINEVYNFNDTEKAQKRIKRYLKTYPDKDINLYAEKIKFEEKIEAVRSELYTDLGIATLKNEHIKEKVSAILDDDKFISKYIKGEEEPVNRLKDYLTGNRYYKLFHDDFRQTSIESESIDLIVTDPPYPKQYLNLYKDLAIFAERVLKPGGSLFAMAGQSYLPEIFDLMKVAGLNYNWTLCYLTPGGQSPQIWQRKVNAFWKPVLWYTKGKPKKWLGDVVKSAVNDNDKNFHFWGQSFSGMNDLIQRVSEPGDLILDPFMGGGTTGIACMYNLRNFIGIEIEKESFNTAKSRLQEIDSLITK